MIGKDKETKAKAVTACNSHHWIIKSPEGARSWGKCRICGDEREFKNSIEYSAWASNTRGGKGRRGGQSADKT